MAVLTTAGAAFAACGATVLAKRFFIRRVNCWFCNADSHVWRRDENSFVCPTCGQYNGFTGDGDYNKSFDERLRVTGRPAASPVAAGSAGRTFSGAGGLCPQCNFNQTLKIEALRNFSPVVEANYDNELRDFKEAVERTYRLCRKCENRVHQVSLFFSRCFPN
jgi:Zn ribbon nucleic-acid-binding protein